MIRTIAYIDGFNLYYGALKGTPFKWLDVSRLCQLLCPGNEFVRIKYFTALINRHPNDPDQPNRQLVYLRALRTIPNLQIIYGHFLTHEVDMPLADHSSGRQHFVRVIKTEEKGSDVNIATHLLHDGYQDQYQAAVLLTNDSDLLDAIKVVRFELNKAVIILNPHPKNPSVELRKYATFVKPIRLGVIAAAQFPPLLRDQNGNIHKPRSW